MFFSDVHGGIDQLNQLCASGVCVNGLCQEGPQAAGEPCDDSADCAKDAECGGSEIVDSRTVDSSYLKTCRYRSPTRRGLSIDETSNPINSGSFSNAGGGAKCLFSYLLALFIASAVVTFLFV
jgi:hypothetical protein